MDSCLDVRPSPVEDFRRRKDLTRISFSLFSIRSNVVLSSLSSRRPAARNAASISVESSRSCGFFEQFRMVERSSAIKSFLGLRSLMLQSRGFFERFRMVERSSAIKTFLGLRSLMYQSHERNFSMKLAARSARSGKSSLVGIVVLPVEISLVSQNGSSNCRAKLRIAATSDRCFCRETRR